MRIKQFLAIFIALTTFSATHSLATIPTINNPEKAVEYRTLEFEEVWRIGADEDSAYVLGVIISAISDDLGNIYLLDTQQSEVFKFSADGQYLKSVSRKGEGPGEINRCYFFGFWDKNTVACFSRFPHKFIRFDLEGIPKSVLTPVSAEAQKDDGRRAMSRFVRRDGYLLGSGAFFLYQDGRNLQKSFLSAFDSEAQETFCFGKKPTGYDFSGPFTVDEEADFSPFRRWMLGLGGEVYIAPNRTKYQIDVHDIDGNLLRTINRDIKPYRRTKEEKETAKNRYSFGVNNMEMPEITYKISDYEPAINSLDWIDGQLWVFTGAGSKQGKKDGTVVVDVFDREGHQLEERTIKLPFDRENDEVHWLDNGRAIVIKNLVSARVAARSSTVKVQRGEKEEVAPDTEAAELEVILYQVKD